MKGDNVMNAKSGIERAAPTRDFLAAPVPLFDHPSDVLARADMPAAERRAILAAWASDAHAVENAPHLRQLANGARVAVSDILDALRRLDGEGGDAELAPLGQALIFARRQWPRTRIQVKRVGASPSGKLDNLARPDAGDLLRVNARPAEGAYRGIEG